MGRWWTGYTSISAGRAGIAHSHGEPWRFAAAWRLQPSYGYGLWKTKIPSEKMCCIAAYGGAGCELYPTGLVELVEKGYVVAGDFSKENHECRHYFLGETFLADLEREDARNLMREKIVRAADGKIACSLKHRYTDDNGKRISPLNCAAMETLKTNVINLWRIECGLRDLEMEARREKHYRKRKRLEHKIQKIESNLKYVLRQWHMP